MNQWIKQKVPGIALCFAIAVPSWMMGNLFPIIGGAVISILLGMICACLVTIPQTVQPGISFVSKKILQWAVILLGFGLNLNIICKTGLESLPIIISTISTSLLISWILYKKLRMSPNEAVLVGVGSSICGGSAIAATAPVIHADEKEVAQSISVIFFFNLLAAVFFPLLGRFLHFSHTSGHAFGIFAGTAINDTSSVTAASSTWDSMWSLGNQTLSQAVTVKLTRTLAIIPITLILSLYQLQKRKKRQKMSVSDANNTQKSFSLRQVFPFFILFFIGASIITTIMTRHGIPDSFFTPLKTLSRFFIVMAMAAIGLRSNIFHLIKTGGKSILLGASCWIGITLVSLILQHFLHIW